MSPDDYRPAPGRTPDPKPLEVDESTCATISQLLARVGDKWTLLTVRTLGDGPMRFNALQRAIGDISQKMLSQTLRNLERDGFVNRTVTPVTPPMVEYELTPLGQDLLCPVSALAAWTAEHADQIEAARRAYDVRNGQV